MNTSTFRILTASIAVLAAPAFAATVIWDGGGADDQFSTVANWNPDGLPATTSDAIFNGSVRIAPQLTGGWTFASMTFNSGASAFVFGGSGSLSINAGGITNNDADAMTFNIPVTALAAETISASAGALVFNSGLSIGANTVALAGNSNITLGSLSGTGTINKTGIGGLTINSSATAIGADLNLSAGTTTLAAVGGTQTFAATSTVTMTGSAGLQLNQNTIFDAGAQLVRNGSGSIGIAAGKTLTLQGGSDLVSASTLNISGGSLTATGAGSTVQATGSSNVTIYIGAAVSVLAGASFTTGGYCDIGTNGIGTLTVDGSGTSFSCAVGSYWGNTGGTANVTFSNNATASIGGFQSALTVGSTAVLQVLSGADVTSSSSSYVGAQIVANPCGSGTLTVDGAGSTWSQTGSTALTIGSTGGGASSVTVQNSGVFTMGTGLTTVNGSGQLIVANNGTFTTGGNVTLTGAGTRLTISSTNAAFNMASGTTLTINNDADAQSNSNFLNAGSNLVVTGSGSSFSTFAGRNIYVFGGSNDSVTLGGSLSAAGAMHIGTNGNGTLSVGGGTASAGSLSIWGDSGNTANVTFSNSSTGTFAAVDMDNNAAAGTTCIVQVLTGSTVTSGNLHIASSGGANSGTLTMDGIGSAWTQNGAGTFTLGAAANSTGTLTVSNGGAFSSGTGAFTIGATGTVNISGGTLTINGALTQGGAFNFTAGTLNLLGANNLAIGTGGLFGANLTLLSDRTLNVANTTTIEAARTLTINGGTFRTGALTNNGTLDFQKGTLAITNIGGFNIGSGGPLGGNVSLEAGMNLQATGTVNIISGSSLALNGGTLTAGILAINGTLRLNTGGATVGSVSNQAGGRAFVGDSAVVSSWFNYSGSRLTMEGGVISPADMLFSSMTNDGLITGDGNIAVTTTNAASGDIRAESGKTLYFTGAFAANAGDMILDGGKLDFASAIANSATGYISGRGALYTGGLTNNGVMAFSGGVTDIRGDVTNAAGGRIVTSGAGSTTTFFDDLAHNGTEIFTGANASTVIFGAQTGAGNFTGTGTVYSNGDLRPGNSPATVSYGGSLVLGTGTLTMELGGLIEGTQYDSLQIASSFYADGILSLALINGYMPGLGAMFDILDYTSVSGTFDSFALPALAQYLAWNTSALYTTGEVSVQSTLTPIEQWRLLHFNDPANTGDGADDNDFDGDGAQNLLEYALALDPLVPSADGLPALSIVTVGPDKHIALTIVRPLSATDITYRFDVSGTLASYDTGSSYSSGGDVPANAFTTQVSRTDDGTFETIVVRDNTPLTGAARRFLRLKVSNP